MKKNRLKLLCYIFTPIIILSFIAFYLISSIPSTIFVREGEKYSENILVNLSNNDLNESSNLKENNEKKLNVKFLGILPIKSININKVPGDISVYPGGQPIGIKLNTKGVLVVALSDIEVEGGKSPSPAAESGIQIGDSIIKINDKQINNCIETTEIINSLGDEEIKITIDRNGDIIEKNVKPLKSKLDDRYKIGLWIRDCTAGVGTLTFYYKDGNKFAALGHPITDSDTGSILKVSQGEIVSSSIISIRKGTKGKPGELRGIFVDEDKPLGKIDSNTKCGVFGTPNKELKNDNFSKPIKIALRNEIKEGPAKIIATVDGDTPKSYDINIEKLLDQDQPGSKSMIIRITDPELLKKTGGIIQGMSGSPIIQDNKLVGAVTHVLINKPDVGYGVYIEWMLKDAGILSK